MQRSHITISVRDRRHLARDEAERRRVVRALATTALDSLILFAVADEHVHAVVRAWKTGLVARDLRQTLRRVRPELEFKPADIEPVLTDAHMRRLVSYELGQIRRHDLAGHPAIATGSCFQDLARARLLPGFDPTRLQAELPAFRLREVFSVVWLEPRPLIEATDDELRRLGAGRIVDLAAGVFCLPPDLSGSSRAMTHARALAVQVAVRVNVRLVDIANALRLTRQSAWELARRPTNRPGELALRRRLVLEQRAQTDDLRSWLSADDLPA